MTYRLVVIVPVFLILGCATSNLSFEEIRENQVEFIEVSIGPTIFASSKTSRALLTSEGILMTEKRNFFGSLKVKSVQIDPFLTDSLFTAVSSQQFQSVPLNLDQNCSVSYQSQYQNKISIGGFKTDQPTKSIRYKNLSGSRTIVWRECSALAENIIDELRTKVSSESEYESLVKQNEQISISLKMLHGLLSYILSLNT